MSVPTSEPYVGARKEIALTKETTRGTATPYAAGDWQPHEGFDFAPMVEKMRDERAKGRIEQVVKSYIHKRSSEGSIPLAVTKDFIGDIMNMIFGQAPTTTGPSGSIYTHSWTVKNSNRHQSYSIHVKDPVAGMLKYALGMLNEAAFELSVDNYARVKLGMMASKEETGVAGTPSYSTDYEYPIWMPQEITYKIAANVAGLAAETARDVNSLPFTVSKNTAKRFGLGQEEPIDIINQRLAVGGSITTVYDDLELRQLAHARATRALQIKFTDSTTILTLTFPQVAFEEWNDDEDNNAYMNNTVAWFAQMDDTEGLMTATLENIISIY